MPITTPPAFTRHTIEIRTDECGLFFPRIAYHYDDGQVHEYCEPVTRYRTRNGAVKRGYKIMREDRREARAHTQPQET
jgi:hypothetical protein